MSTPVMMGSPGGSDGSGSPSKSYAPVRVRASTEELKVQMQHLIDLQNEQQTHSVHESYSSYSNSIPPSTAVRPPLPKIPSASDTAAADMVKSKLSQQQSSRSKAEGKPSATLEMMDSEVGRGTLLFSNQTMNKKLSRLDSEEKERADADVSSMTTPRGEGLSLKKSTNQLHLASYGTDEVGPGLVVDSASQYAVSPNQEHDFHYGNPDYHHAFLDYHERNRPSSACCCLWEPILHCFQSFLHSEALHRSFCYGAIDGMLTGSGIVAAFCGLGILTPSSSGPMRTLVLIFAAAACFADSICMALGHVWTTRILVSTAARERHEAKERFEQNKADAKGQLVEIFLSKGMLKIDAMSLADTLEGYPDLFVSALIGESLSGPSNDAEGYNNPGDFGSGDGPYSYNTTAGPHMRVMESYGRLNDYEMMDPEAHAANLAAQEARKEAFFMMLGFSSFAIIPSIIFQFLPQLASESISETATLTSITATTATTPSDGSLNPATILVSIAGMIMWLLGVWKSRFLDSNWLLFGVETVVLLLVCIASSYFVASGLKHTLLPGFTLEPIKVPSS